MKYLINLFIFIFVYFFTFSQSSIYTLEECLNFALMNNFEVQRENIQLKISEINAKQSKVNLLPDLNAFVSHGVNRGRSIDPFTNTYVNQQVEYSSHSIGSSVMIFNGLRNQYNMKANVSAFIASNHDVQQVKDQIAINVILAYLQVLRSKELIQLQKNSWEVSLKQVDRLEKLNERGAISPPQLHELKGQSMEEELALITAQNSLETSKLALAQLMNIPYNSNMELESINVEGEQPEIALIKSSEEIYTEALQNLSVVKATEFRVKSNEARVKSIRGEYYPSIRLNGNLTTNYSSAAIQNLQEIPYKDQLENNLFSNINIGINIPLFNAAQTRARVKLASLDLENMKVEQESIKMQLRQEIEQAHQSLKDALARMHILERQVKEYEEVFRAAEVMFNIGAGTSIDYLVAKNNYDRVSINFINAKYELFLRLKILQFYKGNHNFYN